MTDDTPHSPSTITRRGAGLGLLGVAACSQPASAQIARTNPLALRRGIGVHHMLNWAEFDRDGYRWPPFTRADYQSTDEEMANLRNVGFDFVRLTVGPDIFMASEGAHSADLARILRDRVARFRAAGLNVIVDLHPTSRNPAYAPARLWEGAGALVFRRYVEIVGEVAGVIADMDGVAFELMNEPQAYGLGAAYRWQEMSQRLVNSARAQAPTLPLIVSGGYGGGHEGLVISRPFDDPRIIYTFHYYSPLTFTHQGAIDDASFISKLPWPASESSLSNELRAATQRINAELPANQRARAIETARNELREYFENDRGEATITEAFGNVARWADQHGIPRGAILLGEFGVVRFHRQYQGAQERHRTRWLRAVRTEAERLDFGWSVWAYRGDGGMALVDEESVLAFDQPSLRALGLNVR
jgi:endoglucanase